MNLQTSMINNKGKRNRKSKKSRKKSNFSFVTLLKFTFPIAVIFGMSAAMTLCNSETEKLNRETIDLNGKIHDFKREIADLTIMCEKYKGRFILEQIAKFKLKLGPAKPHQVKKLELRKSAVVRNISSSERLYVSQR